MMQFIKFFFFFLRDALKTDFIEHIVNFHNFKLEKPDVEKVFLSVCSIINVMFSRLACLDRNNVSQTFHIPLFGAVY